MSRYYLCVDLKKNGNEKEETCFLVEDDLKALLKFTSYCKDKIMLLNTINKRYGKDIIPKNLNGDFYIKKTKSNNSDIIDVLYEKDEDILYTETNDLFRLITNNRLDSLNDYNVIKLFELLASLITDSSIVARINKTFYEKYDSDKNPEYSGMENLPLWKKIILVRDNLKLVLDNICKDTYKKMLFNIELKKIINKDLIKPENIQNKKELLDKKLKKKKSDATSIFNKIKINIDEFYGIKPDIKKEKEVITNTSYTFNNADNYDDFISYYKGILVNCDDDEKDDVILYLDEIEKEKRKNKNI